jgi:hypothetical protein
MVVANFDIIPHSSINNFIFTFEEKADLNDVRFQNLGFDTYNFVLNSGTTMWLIFIWIVLSLVTLCLRKISKLNSFVNYLYKNLFYGMIIRISLECYVELLISAYLNS